MIYQSHFGFKQAPFSLTPTTALFQGLDSHYEAIQTVLSAIDMDEGIIKVTGEVGSGKTLICRMLINHLYDKVYLIYLPNPVMTGLELKQAVAKELAVPLLTKNNLPNDDELQSSELINSTQQTPELINASVDSVSLVDSIHERLLEISREGKKIVALIDEAQALSDEAIETLRLFGNLETEHRKLLQIVILGQPELDERLAQYHLRQFRQRITFSAKLRLLNEYETSAYIDYRIEKTGGDRNLFSKSLKKAIWKASKGTPRMINQICHKALLLAFMEGVNLVSTEHVYNAIYDTYDTVKPKFKFPRLWGWSSDERN